MTRPNAFTMKPDVSRITKELSKAHNSSVGGTRGAQRVGIVQSPSLPIFKLRNPAPVKQ